MTALADDSLGPAACGDPALLRAFVQSRISPNAWPIHSPVLRQHLQRDGLCLAVPPGFIDLAGLARMLRFMGRRGARLEHRLQMHNAFHCTRHNHEVLLRLLLLEWPDARPLPAALRDAATHVHASLDQLTEVLLELLRQLVAAGVALPTLACAVLAGLGHDYGHSGGTERRDAQGRALPLTHEDMAEKHSAAVGLQFGMPPALVLASMAAIRATTFYQPSGRARVQAVTDLEHKLKLADVMGCALPMPLWLTHVGLPVLAEKLPAWRLGLIQLPGDIAAWLRSERGFFLSIAATDMRGNAAITAQWRATLRDKIAWLDGLLARQAELAPWVAQGFGLLERLVSELPRLQALAGGAPDVAGDPELHRLWQCLSAGAPDLPASLTCPSPSARAVPCAAG